MSSPTKLKKPKVKLTSEHAEQCFLFAWAEFATGRYPELALLHAIPNYARVSPKWGVWMKAEGKRAGVPDVHLPVARGGFSSLYIEMKIKPNKTSAEQNIWHERLRAAGNDVHVCWSWEEARACVEAYLTMPQCLNPTAR